MAVPDRVVGRVARARCCVVAPSGHDIKTVSRPTPAARRVARAQHRVVVRYCLVAALYRSLAAPYRDTKGRPQPQYKLLYRDSQDMAARELPHAPRAGWPCRGPCWPCRGAVSQGLLAVSWPSTARPSALCHNTIHCIVT